MKLWIETKDTKKTREGITHNQSDKCAMAAKKPWSHSQGLQACQCYVPDHLNARYGPDLTRMRLLSETHCCENRWQAN